MTLALRQGGLENVPLGSADLVDNSGLSFAGGLVVRDKRYPTKRAMPEHDPITMKKSSLRNCTLTLR